MRAIRPAIFLDRDDTLCRNADLPEAAYPGKFGDLFLPEYVELLPGVEEACRGLRAAGFALVLITSQSGVARGACTVRDVEATHDALRRLLPADGVGVGDGVGVERGGGSLIEAAYFSIHHPTESVRGHLASDHHWRKPLPGMVLAAAEELGLDLARSWMIGDKERDVGAGIAAGLDPTRCLRIGAADDADAADLLAASRIVLDSVAPATATVVVVEPAATARLTARSGSPLRVSSTRGTVEAAARAIAERTGVPLLSLELDDSSVTAVLATHRLAATAFMAELRAATNRWHLAKFAVELW
ncbi:MAG: HAD-IIIA family hydrolase [Planctomycetota bacterium]